MPAESPAAETGRAASELAAERAPVSVGTETEGRDWDAYLSVHPDATVEHLWGWRDVFQRAFGHDCVYLAARRDGRVTGILPLVRYRSPVFGRFLVSLPYFNYAGIVADDGVARSALIARAVELASDHRAKHVELRHRERQVPEQPVRQNKVGLARELPATGDALWSTIDRKVRNQVRKAQKEGLSSEHGGAGLVEAFYPVFAENMRDLGTPVFPRALFTEACRVFPDSARVFVVRAGPQPVAGGILLSFRDTALVPWASSLRAFRQQCPNMLLYWSMMEWCVQQGLRVFDFGRSTAGAGTQQFKQQWGGVPRPLYTEYLVSGSTPIPDLGTTNPSMQRAIDVWQRLPLGVANWIGPLIIKHLA